MNLEEKVDQKYIVFQLPKLKQVTFESRRATRYSLADVFELLI